LKILLTGATGFTGRHFNNLAKASGHEIVALQANLNDAPALEVEVSQTSPDAVLHLAGKSFVVSNDDLPYYQVHAIGTVNLLNALSKLAKIPHKVVIASSATVYGNYAFERITEDEPAKPMGHYAVSKLATEFLALNFSDRLPIVITRPFTYTGPGQNNQFVIPKIVEHFAKRLPYIELGNLNVEREFNDVRMICAAYLQLLHDGRAGEIYNLCSGQSHTLQSAIQLLTNLTGHSIEIRVNPAFVRKNEVHRMSGNPSKIHSLFLAHNSSLEQYSLQNTLEEMLKAC
jgi:nucleoside-diphosphate-sugar epimerase